MRDSFVFYTSFYEAISELEDKDKLAAYEAVCRYALHGELPEVKGVVAAIFKLIKPQIDANNKRYENGKSGGRPKKEKPNQNQTITKIKPFNNQTETKPKPNVNVNVNVNDNVNERGNTPPTIDEVRNYCKEQNLSISPERFFNYYKARGWKLSGGDIMADWTAALLSWDSKDPPKEQINERNYDYTELTKKFAKN